MKKDRNKSVLSYSGLPRFRLSVLLIVALAAAVACSGQPDPSAPPTSGLSSDRAMSDLSLTLHVFFKPLPDKMPGSEEDTPEKIALGRKLFFDRGLSENQTQSCNDCHRLDLRKAPGADARPTSLGAKGQPGSRNSPTVLNAGFQRIQFWDGRAADLVEQAKGPLLNPVEMAMPSGEHVADRLKNRADLRDDFARAFPGQPDPISLDNVAVAIAAFERTLITPSRFDRYLRGRQTALTATESRGLRRFMNIGCFECHYGVSVGGRTLKKLGIYHAYENQSDTGRFTVAGQEEDRFVFKVGMLRNITLTAPYFHDGKVEQLPEAVRQMAWMQLDKKLTPSEINDIVAFLGSLEAESLDPFIQKP